MVLCREGHTTAKPASGARQVGISTRMAANAHSAEPRGHPPTATGQAGTLVPSRGHEEVGQESNKMGGWASWVPTLALTCFSESP